MGQGLATLDLDFSRLCFPEAPCSDVMKDLTRELQVHEWGGEGKGGGPGGFPTPASVCPHWLDSSDVHS